MGSISATERLIKWRTKALDVVLALDAESRVYMRELTPADSTTSEIHAEHSSNNAKAGIPLNSIRFPGEGNTADKTAKSLIGSYASERYKYQSHQIQQYPDREELTIYSHEPTTQTVLCNHFTVFNDIPVLRTFVTIQNQSPSESLILTQLSSFSIGNLTRGCKTWYSSYTLLTPNNSWFREAQWREQTLPDIGLDNNGIHELDDSHAGSQATYGHSNRGSFSTGSHLPIGILKHTADTDVIFWQIEHNGSWRWEIGDYQDAVYLSAGGPTSLDHNCQIHLKPGETFTTVPVAYGRVSGGVDAAFGALTRYRRCIRRPHPDNERLPIIFNDYMNCLMGDPDEAKIKALLAPVKKSGAEYFVIDAGWYADDAGWWDDVGLWEPSQKRFPSGFKKLLDSIKEVGLTPGLWVEPEVVGIRSPVAKRLPEAAFFHQAGKRVLERGRYQLDYRHPEVIRWMDSVIKRLIEEYGAGYFKFDYNIEVVQGTDLNSCSAGAAHLEHQRAYLSWIRSLLDRYPGLVIENCSSGAQRMDYAMLSVHPLQSTSDQQDPLLYAAIAAAAPTAVTPEQSATWAYPQGEWDDEINAMTVVNSLLGRIHLSGRLDEINGRQTALITDGMNVYKNIRDHLKTSLPFWPLGLPKWHDEWLSLGMTTTPTTPTTSTGTTMYLVVWRRGGELENKLPVWPLKNHHDVRVTLLYPSTYPVEYAWEAATAELCVKLPNKPCARLFELRPQ